MVRIIVAALLLLVVTVPAMAQDEFPRVEMSFGYGNIGFPAFTIEGLAETERHSGFVSQQGFNLTNWFGLANNFGYYSLGNNISLISNAFGGRFALRRGGPAVPYGFAGLGGSFLTDERTFGSNAFTTMLGGGVDLAWTEGMGVRVDLARASYRLGGDWHSSPSFSVGLVFTIF